tara:strand:+ start:121 stop:783 length:663 start_codon:yes stop_codon:yes gene_type:complete
VCGVEERNLYVKNIFISGIAWILFHELGHLVQEHGYVRALYGSGESPDVYNYASGYSHSKHQESRTGKVSAVSHATEMAADYYAIVAFSRALNRHFDGDRLSKEIRNFICSIVIFIYIFDGSSEYDDSGVPVGNHPQPIIRLEQTMASIIEIFSMRMFSEYKNLSLSRKGLCGIVSWVSYSVGLFISRINDRSELPPESYFIMGSLQRPGMVRYHKGPSI